MNISNERVVNNAFVLAEKIKFFILSYVIKFRSSAVVHKGHNLKKKLGWSDFNFYLYYVNQVA